MNQEKIGKFIAENRKIKKLTQKELAEKLGVTDRSVSKWENGICMPDMSLLAPLSKELGVSVNDLLSGKRNDMEDYQEVLEENIVNIVSKVDKDNKKRRLKMVCVSLFIIFIIPLIVLCLGQFFKIGGFPSFSSFKIMNKANQFYEALQKNDIDKVDKLMTDNVEYMCWESFDDNQTKKNFLDDLTILKNKRIEYTSFKVKGFRHTRSVTMNNISDESGVSICIWPSRSGFLVEYEMCFKDYAEKACINVIFQLDDDNKLIFVSSASDSNLLNQVYDKYNPANTGNVYYNELHLFVGSVFNGNSLKKQ